MALCIALPFAITLTLKAIQDPWSLVLPATIMAVAWGGVELLEWDVNRRL